MHDGRSALCVPLYPKVEVGMDVETKANPFGSRGKWGLPKISYNNEMNINAIIGDVPI